MKSIEIVGLWELGWNTPIKEIELWEYLLDDFSVDKFYMSPITGILSNIVKEYQNIEDILNEKEKDNFSLVFVDERGETPLEEFIHPKKVLYVFGKSGLSPYTSYGMNYPNSTSIKIKTIKNGGLLWPHQAAAIVLYDRLVKSWQ